jgi:hypothetical protein
VTAGDQLAGARGWAFDIDGCLMRTARAGGAGGTPFPGAVELVAALKAAGRQIVLCTNASGKPPARYAAHLRELGFDVADDEFVTAGSAAADHVAAHHPGARVLVLGNDGVTAPVAARGLELLDPGADVLADVVVVGAADSYSTAAINAACLAVDAGAPLYVTVQTPWFHGGVGRRQVRRRLQRHGGRGELGDRRGAAGDRQAVGRPGGAAARPLRPGESGRSRRSPHEEVASGPAVVAPRPCDRSNGEGPLRRSPTTGLSWRSTASLWSLSRVGCSPR